MGMYLQVLASSTAQVFMVIGLVINILALLIMWVTLTRSKTKEYKEDMSKKADVTYVNDQIKHLDEKANIQFQHVKESNEEILAVVNHISKRLDDHIQKSNGSHL